MNDKENMLEEKQNETELTEINIDTANEAEQNALNNEKLLTEENNEQLKLEADCVTALENTAKVFGQSKESLESEFNAFKAQKLFKRINYSLLNVLMSDEELSNAIKSAIELGFESVTVFPTKVKKALAFADGKIAVRCATCFPGGSENFKTRCYSVSKLSKLNISSIEIPFDYDAYVNKKSKIIVKELKKLVKTAGKKKLFVVVELGILSAAEISEIGSLCSKAGVYCVKTSSNIYNYVSESFSVETLKKALDQTPFEACGYDFSARETLEFFQMGAITFSSPNALEIVKEIKNELGF